MTTSTQNRTRANSDRQLATALLEESHVTGHVRSTAETHSENRNEMVSFQASRLEPVTRIALDYEAFYATNMERLIRSLTATLGSRTAAQDAAQEAMVKAYRRWDEVSRYANPMGWCYRVALRQGQRSWRKFGREQLTDTFTARATVGEEEGLRPELVKALLELPLTQRSVVVLRVFMGWTIEETAEALDISTGTVSGRYQRGMDTLRHRIGDASSNGYNNRGGAAS